MASTQRKPKPARDDSTKITRVGEGRYAKAKLVEPTQSGYILISAEVDRRLGFLPNSRKKRRLIAECKQLCRQLAQDPSILEAVVFDANFITPGEDKEFLEKRRPGGRFPDFDLSVLIETSNPRAADAVNEFALYERMERAIHDAANDTVAITATNPKRIGPVDHSRNGSFLFNYFVADDTEQMLAVFDYTAGWWEQETGLDNSTVLLPREGQRTDYAIINHCRWDHLWNFMPSILFKRSFRNYVLANFYANNITPRAHIYRLA
jgi:hypothetical protein